MYKRSLILAGALLLLVLAGCSDSMVNGPATNQSFDTGSLITPTTSTSSLAASGNGATVANGWYEGEEIYYILGGLEDGVTKRGNNDIYLIGDDRKYQANVVLFIPGEEGYSPHWNVNVVTLAAGVTLADVLASPWASAHYPEALFDDVEDILDAKDDGLIVINRPGAVVLCPIVPEIVADAPGNTELSEEFPPFPDVF